MSVMKVCCEVVRQPSNELWEFDETRKSQQINYCVAKNKTPSHIVSLLRMISLASASSMTSTVKVISSSGDNTTHNVNHRRIPPSKNRCAPRAFSKRNVELGDCCFKSGGSDRFRCSRSSSIRNSERKTSGRVVKCKHR